MNKGKWLGEEFQKKAHMGYIEPFEDVLSIDNGDIPLLC